MSPEYARKTKKLKQSQFEPQTSQSSNETAEKPAIFTPEDLSLQER